ncbi:hypothetical protein C8F04DRAFT_912887, partial [Mycena alexandri]
TGPAEAPQWFRDCYVKVSGEVLGDEYAQLLKEYVTLEQGYGFAKGRVALKGRVERPDEVSDWVRDGRGRTKKVRPIANLPAYAARVRAWWDGLQPPWREKWDEGEVLEEEGTEWGTLASPGQNGMLSVMAALYWWGIA